MKLLGWGMFFLGLGLRAWADDAATVQDAVVKVAELPSYTFRSEIRLELPLSPGAGPRVPALEGRFQKDVGWWMSAGERGELFRKGDRTFVKAGAGDWTELDRAPLAGAGAGATRARGAAVGRMMLRALRAPHEELRDLARGGFKDLRKEDRAERVGDRDCTVYGGELTEEAVRSSPLGRMIGPLGILGVGGQGAELSGKLRVWIDPEGRLVKYEVNARVSVEFQGNPIELTMGRATELSAPGMTRVEVPPAVEKLLEGKPDRAEDRKDP